MSQFQFSGLKKIHHFFFVFAFIPLLGRAQNQAFTEVPLTDLSAFKNPSANWSIAGAVNGRVDKPFEVQIGQGILVNDPGQKKNDDIFTNFEHGDIDLSVDFMMPPGSNSSIYLQGRYKIQLPDSWGKDVLTWQDYEGVAPRMNVSRAPGLWQNLHISFTAPKFDSSGKKTANARIARVVLNGAPIIENVELTGPAPGSAFADEAPKGPLRLQGDHGAIAFRNLKYSTRVVAADYNPDGPQNVETPAFIEVDDAAVVQRSFVRFEGKIVPHAVNVGFPHHVSFAYDLENGAVFQVWKGNFLNATPMWWSRGDGTTRANGSVLQLNAASPLAVLNTGDATWPDSLSDQLPYTPKGYELDDTGCPTFKYTLGGLAVDDKISPLDSGKRLVRRVAITGTVPQNLFFRVAAGKSITAIGDGMYSVNDYEYYLQISNNNKDKPILRTTAAGQELLLPVKDTDKRETIEYSMIW